MNSFAAYLNFSRSVFLRQPIQTIKLKPEPVLIAYILHKARIDAFINNVDRSAASGHESKTHSEQPDNVAVQLL